MKQKRKRAALLKERHNTLVSLHAEIKVLIAQTSEESPENAKLLSAFENILSKKVSRVLASPCTSEIYDELDREFLNILSALANISEKNDPTLLIEQIKGGKPEEKTLVSNQRKPPAKNQTIFAGIFAALMLVTCLLYTSPSPRDRQKSRMPSSA